MVIKNKQSKHPDPVFHQLFDQHILHRKGGKNAFYPTPKQQNLTRESFRQIGFNLWRHFCKVAARHCNDVINVKNNFSKNDVILTQFIQAYNNFIFF